MPVSIPLSVILALILIGGGGLMCWAQSRKSRPFPAHFYLAGVCAVLFLGLCFGVASVPFLLPEDVPASLSPSFAAHFQTALALTFVGVGGLVCWACLRNSQSVAVRWLLVGSCVILLFGSCHGIGGVHHLLHIRALTEYVSEIFEGLSAGQLPRFAEDMPANQKDALAALVGEPLSDFEIEEIYTFTFSLYNVRVRFPDGEFFDLHIRLADGDYSVEFFKQKAQ